MKDAIEYYGDALAKVAIGGFLIGMGAHLSTSGIMLYGAKKLLANAAALDEAATQTFMNVMAEKMGK